MDGDAPYLSSYLVEVMYPYEPFIAQYSEENQKKLTVTNDATLTYRLLGDNENRTAKGTASIQAGEVTQPRA